MNRRLLFIPRALVIALFWQLMRNADSAEIGSDRRPTAAAQRLGHQVPDLPRRVSVSQRPGETERADRLDIENYCTLG